MDREVRVRADKEDMWWEGVKLHIFKREGGKTFVVKSVEFEEIGEGEYPPAPLFIPTTSAQELIDSLWSCGLRPTDGAGSAGAMAKAEGNLKDLREVVSRLFGLLEKRE